MWRRAGRRQPAELNGAAAGRRWGKLRRVFGTRLWRRLACGRISLADSGWPVGGRSSPPGEGSLAQKGECVILRCVGRASLERA